MEACSFVDPPIYTKFYFLILFFKFCEIVDLDDSTVVSLCTPLISTFFYIPIFVKILQKKMSSIWIFVLLPNIRVSPFENAQADVYFYRTLLFSDFSPSEKEMIPSVCITKRNVK